MGNIILNTPNERFLLYPSTKPAYINSLKTFSAIVSVLSIIGAIAVVFSYISCCKKLHGYKYQCNITIDDVKKVCFTQTSDDKLPSRFKPPAFHYFVVFLSIADIMVGISHIWGLLQGLENKFMPAYSGMNITEDFNVTLSTGHDNQCTVQAALAIFSTVSSFLWTLALISSLCCMECCPGKGDSAHCCDSRFVKYFFCQVFAWGIPAVLVCAMSGLEVLGFTETYDPGWCYYSISPEYEVRKVTSVIIIGYEVWVWVPLVLILFFSITFATMVYLRSKGKCLDPGVKSRKCTADDSRYILIAFAIIGLRIPALIIDVVLIRNRNAYKSKAIAALNWISALCVSGQGLVNAVIFLCCRNTQPINYSAA